MSSPYIEAKRALLKATIGMEGAVRSAQLNQYFYPERDILPKTDLRPTSLTKFKDQDFRSIAHFLPNKVHLPSSIVGKNLEDLELPLKLNADEVLSPREETRHLMFPNINIGLGRKLGLGNATFSIGNDPKTGPYLSVFDSWDFGDDDPLSQFAMKGVGKAFNVYDRIPIQLDEKGRIPASITRDIALPKEPKRQVTQ